MIVSLTITLQRMRGLRVCCIRSALGPAPLSAGVGSKLTHVLGVPFSHTKEKFHLGFVHKGGCCEFIDVLKKKRAPETEGQYEFQVIRDTL